MKILIGVALATGLAGISSQGMDILKKTTPATIAKESQFKPGDGHKLVAERKLVRSLSSRFHDEEPSKELVALQAMLGTKVTATQVLYGHQKRLQKSNENQTTLEDTSGEESDGSVSSSNSQSGIPQVANRRNSISG